MPDSFDPYLEWLGVPGGEDGPDYYRLLGLRPFESDVELIARRADMAMARVRGVRPGIHSSQWSELLDLLVAAKTCLLNPASKAFYDGRLKAQSSLPPLPTAPSEPAVVVPPPVVKSAVRRASASGQDATDSTPSWTGPIVAGVLLLVLGVAGVALNAWHKPQTPAARTPASAAPTAKTVAAPSSAPPAKNSLPQTKPQAAVPSAGKQPGPGSQPASALPPLKPAVLTVGAKPTAAPPLTAHVEPAKPKPVIDAQKANLFTRLVADARAALTARDITAAEQQIKAAAGNAQTAEEAGQVDRVQTMLENLTQFWSGIRASMAKFRPADELMVEGTPMIVVESRDGYLEVKTGGRRYQYRAETLPTPLVLTIVEQSFGKDPGSKAVIATFLATDPQGDRAGQTILARGRPGGFRFGEARAGTRRTDSRQVGNGYSISTVRPRRSSFKASAASLDSASWDCANSRCHWSSEAISSMMRINAANESCCSCDNSAANLKACSRAGVMRRPPAHVRLVAANVFDRGAAQETNCVLVQTGIQTNGKRTK